MGRDKAEQVVGGVRLAELVARALCKVVDPVFVVGPHVVAGLRSVSDAGVGPLGALVSGWEQLLAEGQTGPVVVAACDLPFVTSDLVAFLVGKLGDADAVCPVFQGRDQVLLACYAPVALERATRLTRGGERSLRALLAEMAVNRIPEQEWSTVAPLEALLDVDTPEELEAARRLAELRPVS
jgi:molybdenum cofactor guanylyltransferase